MIKKTNKPKRNKEIKIKMLPSEYLAAQKKALEAGYPLATYARYATLNKHLYDKPQRAINAKYLSQLAWIGNNINQMARVANTLRAQSREHELNLIEFNLRLAEMMTELDILRAHITSGSDGSAG